MHVICECVFSMRLYDNLREWTFPPWDDGPILTLTDLLRINHVHTHTHTHTHTRVPSIHPSMYMCVCVCTQVRRLISDAFGPVSVHQEQPQHSVSGWVDSC